MSVLCTRGRAKCDCSKSRMGTFWEVVRFAPPPPRLDVSPVMLPSAPPSLPLPLSPSVPAPATAAAAAAAAPSPPPNFPGSAPWTLASIRADTKTATIGLCSFVSLGALLFLCCKGRHRLLRAMARDRDKPGPAHDETGPALVPGVTLLSTRRLGSKKAAGSAANKLMSTAPNKQSDACVHADDAPGIALTSMTVVEIDQTSQPRDTGGAPGPRDGGGLILLPPKAKGPVQVTASGGANAPLGQAAEDRVSGGAAGNRATARARAFTRLDVNLD